MRGDGTAGALNFGGHTTAALGNLHKSGLWIPIFVNDHPRQYGWPVSSRTQVKLVNLLLRHWIKERLRLSRDGIREAQKAVRYPIHISDELALDTLGTGDLHFGYLLGASLLLAFLEDADAGLVPEHALRRGVLLLALLVLPDLLRLQFCLPLLAGCEGAHRRRRSTGLDRSHGGNGIPQGAGKVPRRSTE